MIWKLNLINQNRIVIIEFELYIEFHMNHLVLVISYFECKFSDLLTEKFVYYENFYRKNYGKVLGHT